MLIALFMVIGLQALRVLFALAVFHLAPTRPFQELALLLVGVFSAPFWLSLLLSRFKPQTGLTIAIGGMAFARLVLQFSPSVSLSLILATITVMLWLTVIALPQFWTITVGANGQVVSWLIVGLAIDAALNSLFLTWDYAWQRDISSVLCALVVTGVTGVALWQFHKSRPDSPKSTNRPLPLVLLGPYLMLQIVVLQNPAFVAAVTGATIPATCAIVLAGGFISQSPLRNFLIRAPIAIRLLAAVMIAGLFVLDSLVGIVAIIAIIVIQFVVNTLLFAALQPVSNHTNVSAGFAGLLLLALTVAYYLEYQYATLISVSAWICAGVGLLLAGLAFRNLSAFMPLNLRPMKITAALFVAPLALFATQPSPSTVSVDGAFRLVVYNIHQGANTQGWIDLEALAKVIEVQNPDVVVLQEVIRGQLITGGVDIAQWLAVRLNMPYYFAPAMDQTFGVMLLTRLPIADWKADYLPKAGGVQRRSYFQAVLNLNAGDQVTVIGTHFDHTSAQVRIEQAQHLVELWDGKPRTIIAGDLNARPDSAEMELFIAAGMINAQDATGNESLATFPSANPRVRIDWIFGSPDLTFSDFSITRTLASDHLPLSVTVALEG